MLACAKGAELELVTDSCCPKKIELRFSLFTDVVCSFLGKPILRVGGERKEQNNTVHFNAGEYFHSPL